MMAPSAGSGTGASPFAIRQTGWYELPASPRISPSGSELNWLSGKARSGSALADATPVLIWSSGTDKLCNYFNKQWLDFTGRTLEQETGNGWVRGVHPDDIDRCLTTYVAAFESCRPFTMEYRLRRHDGKYRWVLDNGVPRFAADGTFSGYIGSCLDITDRRRSEVRLRQSEERFRRIVETVLRGDLGPRPAWPDDLCQRPAGRDAGPFPHGDAGAITARFR